VVCLQDPETKALFPTAVSPANDHPAAVGGDFKSFLSLEIKPIRRHAFPCHVGLKQFYSRRDYSTETCSVHKHPPGAGILPPEGLDQLPCAHSVEISGKLNVKIADAATKTDVKSLFQVKISL
jgi:hypothetical protein